MRIEKSIEAIIRSLRPDQLEALKEALASASEGDLLDFEEEAIRKRVRRITEDEKIFTVRSVVSCRTCGHETVQHVRSSTSQDIVSYTSTCGLCRSRLLEKSKEELIDMLLRQLGRLADDKPCYRPVYRRDDDDEEGGGIVVPKKNNPEKDDWEDEWEE